MTARDEAALNRAILQPHGLEVDLDGEPTAGIEAQSPRARLPVKTAVMALLAIGLLTGEYLLLRPDIPSIRAAVATEERAAAERLFAAKAELLRADAARTALAQCPQVQAASESQPVKLPPPVHAVKLIPPKGIPLAAAAAPRPQFTVSPKSEPQPRTDAPILAIDDKPQPAAVVHAPQPAQPARAAPAQSIVGQALPFEIAQGGKPGISAVTTNGVSVLDDSGQERLLHAGEVLPDGSRIIRFDARTGVIVTNRKVIKVL